MINFLLKKSKLNFIIFSISLSIIFTFSLSAFFQTFSNKPIHSEIVRNYSVIRYFISSIIIAPIIETLIFQVFIIELINKVFGNKWLIRSILISGLIFGLLHYFNTYNLAYTLYTIFMGLFFAFIYVIAKVRKDTIPFQITLICHFLVNLIAFLPKIFPTLSKFL